LERPIGDDGDVIVVHFEADELEEALERSRTHVSDIVVRNVELEQDRHFPESIPVHFG